MYIIYDTTLNYWVQNLKKIMNKQQLYNEINSKLTVGTKTQSRSGNTSRLRLRVRSRRWCFTLNNYDTQEYEVLKKFILEKTKFYILAKEKGDIKETPHLQGYIEFNNPIEFNSIKKLNDRLHIEKAKGTRQQNIDYCSKENNFIIKKLSKSNVALPRTCKKISKEEQKKQFLKDVENLVLEQEYNNVTWYQWQLDIIKICESKPDNRKIHWYWEPKGNVGKTFLFKFLAIKFTCIICDGKKNDIFNQVKLSFDNFKMPSIILMDIPRYNNDFINFGVLETLKNGILYSGKYEGEKIIFPIPIVICFSNEPPDKSNMSLDRWDVHRIDDYTNSKKTPDINSILNIASASTYSV